MELYKLIEEIALVLLDHVLAVHRDKKIDESLCLDFSWHIISPVPEFLIVQALLDNQTQLMSRPDHSSLESGCLSGKSSVTLIGEFSRSLVLGCVLA